MATAPDIHQQLWDEALSRVLNLSKATVQRNVHLESRLTELETELALWKRAHSNVVDASKRELQTHNAQITTLHRQISLLESSRNQYPLILCVIDGDGNLFSQSLLAQGHRGGHLAAQQLTKGIAQFLSNENVHMFGGRLSFWASVYLNKSGLVKILLDHGICSREQFESFWVGFSQASPHFSLVDVGDGQEAADTKIREVLKTFIRFPQTLRIFFGGTRDKGYRATLTDLDNEQLLGKLVILRGYADVANEFQTLATLKVDGLFMTQRLSNVSKRPSPLTVTGFSSVTTNGGLISPESPPGISPLRVIDPSLPLHKQDPPPCNEHYLMSCSKGTSCKYSHDYILTHEQLAILASNAKKAPCNWLKNGQQCPYGDGCCWGHVCPSGPQCFHLSKGKCWFKGDNMHSNTSVHENLTF